METIDVQVHAYERDHPGRPWTAVLTGPDSATGDEMVAAMDAVGVDGALLVSPFTMYEYDASYALEVFAAHPTRFRLIKPVNPSDPAVGDTIEEWAATEGTVAIRVMLDRIPNADPDDPGLNQVLETAARLSLPVNMLIWGHLADVSTLAARHPETSMVIDHLGLKQPFAPPAPPDSFGELPGVVALAQYPNVSIKVSGACTLSHEPFPYPDIWDPLEQIFEAFGMERCMWGTDWTRASEILTYEQGVEAFRVTDRLSDNDREALMGGTLKTIYGWD